MSRYRHLVRAFATMLVAMVVGGALPAPAQAGKRAPQGVAEAPELQGVTANADGTITLAADALPPTRKSEYSHFGTYISSPLSFESLFQSLNIRYAPFGTGAVLVDARISLDGTRWTEWHVDLAAGSTVTFDQAGRYAQYRVRLAGNNNQVGIRSVALTPTGVVAFQAMDAPVAPTFKVHATRQGMVGGRTASGHVITKKDRFVSLPSWRSVSRPGRDEYKVRITYKGRSTVVPVYDVGPWNERDDYWNVERERFKDLPRGYPQDHAAYFDGYNKGVAEKGRVRFPTAVDVGDGAWIDDLGIRGDRAVVEVTFLWLGSDPLENQAPAAPVAAPPAPPAPTAEPAAAPPAPPAPTAEPAAAPPAPTAEPAPAPIVEPAPPAPPAPTAPPAPPAPTAEPAPPAPTAEPTAVPPAPTAAPPSAVEVAVDTNSAAFKKVQAKVWYDSPKACANTSAHWTYTTTNAADSENIARWQPALAAESLYDVSVYVPNCTGKKARTTTARYIIKHRDGQAEVIINQETNGGQWVSLGRYPFAAGDSAFVELRDVTGDSMRVLWYDAVKWVPAK